MIKNGLELINGTRVFWLDNLRTFMIFLVILLHTVTVYEKYGMGSLWWIICDPIQNDVPGILFIILNIFVIAALFFISGYLAPRSLHNKTGWEFIRGKFKRLIIPWAIAVLTLLPVYKIIFLYSRNLPQEHWTTYFHWNTLWSQNWLWFIPVLFLFNILYVGVRKIPVNIAEIPLKRVLLAVLSMSFVYSFFMEIFNLHGWTKTVVLDFQNERLLIYFLAFLFGSYCYKMKVFNSINKNKKRDTILHSIGWIPMNLYIFLLIYGLINPEGHLISKIVDTAILRLSFVLSLAYLLYAMVTTFQNYCNRNGKIWNELNNNSYGVYIIHVIVMGILALMLKGTSTPSLIKLLIVTIATFILSNGIVFLYRSTVKTRRVSLKKVECINA